ncbi:MAG: PD-(D/E)XK nuclease family protein [Elusimicrobia bacterium]|nr:PD-(D/E)XK nuclease family protein [Elusimicrobiota bacterium]
MKRSLSAILSLGVALQGLPAAAQNMGRAAKPAPVPVVNAGAGYVPMFNFSVGSPNAAAIAIGGTTTLQKSVTVGGKLALGPVNAASGRIAVGAAVNAPSELAGAAQNAPQTVQAGAAAMTTLAAVSQAHTKADRPKGNAADIMLGMKSFDGSGSRLEMRDMSSSIVGPAFETPMPDLAPPQQPPADEGDDDGDKRLKLSFSAAQKTGLLSYEPTLALNAKISRVRDFEGSRAYWANFKKGVEIDIVAKGENVYDRPTTITRAVTKKIKDLTREDFRGTVPEHQLKAGVRALRASLISQLEEKRKSFNGTDPMVTGNTNVRVVVFKSYLEMFRETHGPNTVPTPEKPAPRAPLVVDTENPVLNPFTRILPRAVFLDLDMLEGPVSGELLSDMAKLQRTGVYFVAFSRKPYAAANSIKERLIRKMSSYQLGILMPIRFMMVTDDGAVISDLPKGGSVSPIDVEAFSPAQMDVFRDAARKAAEEAGLSPKAVREAAQPRLDDFTDEIPGLARKKKAQTQQPDVRFEVTFPKTATEAQVNAWRAAFDQRIAAQGLTPVARIEKGADGVSRYVAQKTSMAQVMPRLRQALGNKFGLYMNPGDALVLTDDPALMKANEGAIDIAKETGLKGSALLENALGLLLGEHRENREGDLAGSASRMASFTRDRHRYLTESLVDQDKEEQNINFFSGHVVHAANDWLVYELQQGRKPTKNDYEKHLRAHWEEGLLETKPIGLPQGHNMSGWLSASVERGRGMYDFVVAAFDRGEKVIGTEIPNFFIVKDYQRRSGEVKRRYILHTIFDFITLRPDPNKPGQAKLVIYDFKTGPTKTRKKLNADLQVLTYSLFAHERWYGRDFPVPYLVGPEKYKINDVGIEFIYNAVKQVTTIKAGDRDKIRKKIISTLNGIHAAEQQMLGLAPAKTTKAKADKKPKTKRSSK